mmetsp:Transcript_51291/g.166306  ORF Transcript_51291/g.166306 Transcript_51291/m.166306 type:complete len:270 (-) Transcript_51291:3702-4511(-)
MAFAQSMAPGCPMCTSLTVKMRVEPFGNCASMKKRLRKRWARGLCHAGRSLRHNAWPRQASAFPGCRRRAWPKAKKASSQRPSACKAAARRVWLFGHSPRNCDAHVASSSARSYRCNCMKAAERLLYRTDENTTCSSFFCAEGGFEKSDRKPASDKPMASVYLSTAMAKLPFPIAIFPAAFASEAPLSPAFRPTKPTPDSTSASRSPLSDARSPGSAVIDSAYASSASDNLRSRRRAKALRDFARDHSGRNLSASKASSNACSKSPILA